MNASDITVKNPLKIAFQKTRNYYNDNNNTFKSHENSGMIRYIHILFLVVKETYKINIFTHFFSIPHRWMMAVFKFSLCIFWKQSLIGVPSCKIFLDTLLQHVLLV